MNLMIAIALYCLPAPDPQAAMRCQKYLINCTEAVTEAPEKQLRGCLIEAIKVNQLMCEK